MLGLPRIKNRKRYSAYTLAEMLIVMMIMILVMLSLPMATKKVFKLEDTRKSHGRYECYWGVNEGGNKVLMTYTAEENGREILAESATATEGKCMFKAPMNSIYFMVHAVGGGGAGAQIESGLLELEPTRKITATSYLYKSSPAVYPDWITYLINVTPASESLPWGSKNSFDVAKTNSQQVIRYRLSGSAAKIQSVFVPQLPGVATLEIIPGKGGELSTNNQGSGENGEDTIVNYVYTDTGTTKSFEGLRARGGVGGNGTIDGKIAVMMVGSRAGDFGLSKLPAIESKPTEFSTIIESADRYEALQSKITYDAGSGGNGETQYVSTTSGDVLYEYDKRVCTGTSAVSTDCIFGVTRRLGSTWENITDKVGLNVYKSIPRYNENGYNCISKKKSNIEVTRGGYCTYYEGNPFKAACTVGKNTKTSDLDGCSSGNCSKFEIDINSTTGAVTMTPNPTSYASSHKYYNCKFSRDTMRITCTTKLNNVQVHECTTSSETGGCANGATPIGSGTKKRCPATAGGDGAVVILW